MEDGTQKERDIYRGKQKIEKEKSFMSSRVLRDRKARLVRVYSLSFTYFINYCPSLLPSENKRLGIRDIYVAEYVNEKRRERERGDNGSGVYSGL